MKVAVAAGVALVTWAFDVGGHRMNLAHHVPKGAPGNGLGTLRPQFHLVTGYVGKSSGLYPSIPSLSFDELCWDFLDKAIWGVGVVPGYLPTIHDVHDLQQDWRAQR